MILETERLYLREMDENDFGSLCEILQDEETMYAYNGAFDDEMVHEWLDKQLARYREYCFGLWAVCLKNTDDMIGQCGITVQEWLGTEKIEVGYLFNRKFWHKGYATEAAIACKDYAFTKLDADEVCSIIRDNNIPSIKVALRNGMTRQDGIMAKHYRGIDMPHYLYLIKKEV